MGKNGKQKKVKLLAHSLVPYGRILQAWAVTVLLFHPQNAACSWGIFGISFPDFNTPGGEHDQTFKKKSLQQEKKQA